GCDTTLNSAAQRPTTLVVRSSRPPGVPPSEPVANPTLDRAEQLLNRGRYESAHEIISPWLKNNPKAKDRDRALFLLARVHYQDGERFRSFYHLDELMDYYPESRLF